MGEDLIPSLFFKHLGGGGGGGRPPKCPTRIQSSTEHSPRNIGHEPDTNGPPVPVPVPAGGNKVHCNS